MNHKPIMPDFVPALEQQLRAAAVSATAPSTTPSSRSRLGRLNAPRWRLIVAASVATVIAGTIVALPGSNEDGAPRISLHVPAAYGKPRLLAVNPVEIGPEVLGGGAMIRMALGPEADLNSGRPFRVVGGTAYLIGSDKAWCLTVPSSSAATPESRGVTCVPSNVFLRFGISLRMGASYVAAIPQGVRNPTVETPEGTVRDLAPTALGVVTADNLQDGSVITLYAPDGSGRRDRVDLP